MTQEDILKEISAEMRKDDDRYDEKYPAEDYVVIPIYAMGSWLEESLDYEGLLTENFVIEIEESWGGEGEGDSYGYVFSVRDRNNPDLESRYFQIDAYYASWDGVHWDGSTIYEVEPRMVQVRKWFAVK